MHRHCATNTAQCTHIMPVHDMSNCYVVRSAARSRGILQYWRVVTL